jgi:hypothetical protein
LSIFAEPEPEPKIGVNLNCVTETVNLILSGPLGMKLNYLFLSGPLLHMKLNCLFLSAPLIGMKLNYYFLVHHYF